ncbi:MAG: hypothetical protein WDA47_07525 [Bacilli bacterium]
MKRVLKNISVFFIVFTILFSYTFVKPAEVQAGALSTSTIIVSSFLLILAGMIFYNQEDLTEAATEFYNYASSECKEYIDAAASALDEAGEDYINFMVNSDYLNEAIDFYWDIIADNEFLLNAVNNICGVNIVNSVPMYSDISGNSLPVIANAGECYSTMPELVRNLNDSYLIKKNMVINGINFQLVNYNNQFRWIWIDEDGFHYANANGYTNALLWERSKFYYYDDDGNYVDSSLHYYFDNIFHHEGLPVNWGLCIACTVTWGIRTIIVAKYADGDYVIDSPYNSPAQSNKPIDEFFGGSILADYFDIEFGKSLDGAISNSKSGADVLGGSEKSFEVSKSIDDVIGLSSSQVLGSEYSDTFSVEADYSTAYSAAASAAATYTGNYEGNMKEMSIPAVIVQKFPFCIPFDLANAFGAMSSSPELPDLSVSVPFPGFSYEWSIDFTWFDGLVNLIRWFILVIFNIGLILITRNIIRG